MKPFARIFSTVFFLLLVFLGGTALFIGPNQAKAAWDDLSSGLFSSGPGEALAALSNSKEESIIFNGHRFHLGGGFTTQSPESICLDYSSRFGKDSQGLHFSKVKGLQGMFLSFSGNRWILSQIQPATGRNGNSVGILWTDDPPITFQSPDSLQKMFSKLEEHGVPNSAIKQAQNGDLPLEDMFKMAKKDVWGEPGMVGDIISAAKRLSSSKKTWTDETGADIPGVERPANSKRTISLVIPNANFSAVAYENREPLDYVAQNVQSRVQGAGWRTFNGLSNMIAQASPNFRMYWYFQGTNSLLIGMQSNPENHVETIMLTMPRSL